MRSFPDPYETTCTFMRPSAGTDSGIADGSTSTRPTSSPNVILKASPCSMAGEGCAAVGVRSAELVGAGTPGWLLATSIAIATAASVVAPARSQTDHLIHCTVRALHR